jgi:benzoate-CoA ligase family protein
VLTNAAHQQPATVAMPAVVGERFNAAAWLVDRMAAEHPRRTAVTVAAGSAFGSAGASAGASAEDGCDVSYGELAGQVTAAAAALVASGVRAEERVLLCMADGLELMSLFLGALRIGAVPVPVSTMLTAGDLSVLALDSRARLLAVTPDTTALAVAAAGSSPYLRDVVVVGDPLPLPPSLRVRAWSEFLAAAGQAATEAVATPELTVTDSPGFWLYTSGTTGTPKGAMHRHGSLRDTAQTYAREVLAIRPDDVCYSVAKLFFAYGLGNSLTFPFSVGARTVLDPARPTPAGAAEILTRYRPTLFFGVPTFYAALLAAEIPAEAFASVRLCLSAGEPLPAALYARFTRRYGVELLDGIGSTEALHIFLSNRPGRVRPGTTGEPVAGYALRIEDDEGAEVADGEPGHLYVRGESAAMGYWCRAEITRRVFRGPWLRTGDTYVRSPDGYYTYLGRSDDIIKAGGIWVSPAEVEGRLLEHPGVAAVAVVSVLDADGLEKPVACVVPVAGAAVSEDVLVEYCRSGLAAFKRPRRVLLLDALPMTATGKVRRFKVREHAIAVLAGESSRTPAGTATPASS